MTSSHEKLRKRLEQFPLQCVPGKGILEFLEIIFTDEEAKMLSKFKSFQKFLTIEEFASENDYKIDKVQRIFQDLARRNLLRFKKKSNKECFCIHPFVIGIYEAFFAAWREQDPDTLIPAALAVEQYFNDVFYKAASNSRSPWARIMPPTKAVEKLINDYPECYLKEDSSGSSTTEHLRRSTSMLQYGMKEASKRIMNDGIEGVIDMVKKDGSLIFDAFSKTISSFLNTGINPSRSQATKIHKTISSNIKTIDIDRTIPATMIIHPHEVIRNYINQASQISVSPCACRKENQLLDNVRKDEHKKNCNHPVENTCIQLRYDDEEAHEYNLMGGKIVSKEDALKILEECEKAGLVHSTFNSKEKIEFICNCCSCCCGILGTLTRFNQKYRAFIESNFLPFLMSEKCLKCGTCQRKCPVNAITPDENRYPVIDSEKCIGCGVCVSNCSNNALILIKVKDKTPSIDAIEAYTNFANQKID